MQFAHPFSAHPRRAAGGAAAARGRGPDERADIVNLRPLHRTVGAEITGVDLAAALDDETIARIRAAWIEWGVLVFPDQPVSDAEQIAFSRRFGDLEIFPQSDSRSSVAPEVFRVANTDENGALRPRSDLAARFLTTTWMWHTDSCYRPVPSAGAVLHGIEVSREGGETHFADLRAAWDEMPEALRGRVRDLSALSQLRIHALAARPAGD